MRALYVSVLCSIALASCAQTGGIAPAPGALPNANTAATNSSLGAKRSLASEPSADHGYKLLYAFKGGTADGAYPTAALTPMNDSLYGTTALGGTAGLGTAFSVTPSGAETELYSFLGGTDGSYPSAALLEVNGALYGASEGGGGNTCGSYGSGCGTIFDVSASGQENRLYSFDGTDGSTPIAALVSLNGKLYGTTQSGGADGAGTIFELSKSGKEKLLYTFTGGIDGGNPYCGLIVLNGALYGTTFEGGAAPGFGTVFTVSTSGKERVIYSFLGNGQDGENPYAGLVTVNGKLYGTTQEGGANGQGSVFEVTTSGKERVLTSDISAPLGSLLAVNGKLYGTASSGGSYGQGIIFKVSLSGKESQLYNFKGGADGAYPAAGLVAANGTLYGTTELGGAAGSGTIFSIAP